MSDLNTRAAAQPKEKMNVMSAIAYTIGYSGINVSWYMINSYLMLFYTDVVGLAAGAISLIMLIARIWDAINDPMMGAIVDRTNTRWGKFKPYIVIAPPFLAIFNILTFTVFPMEGTKKAVICLLCYIGVGMAYTVVQVAVNGLVNRLSRNSQIKMDIISMSQVGSALIQTALGATVMPCILYFSANHDVADAHGYFMAAIIFSLVAIPMFWFCAWKCREIHDDAAPAAAVKAPEKKKEPILKSLKALGKNNQLILAIFSVFVGAMGAIARMSMLTYYLIYVSGAYQHIAITFSLISGFQMVGNVTLPFFTRKLGKKGAFILFNTISVATLLVLFFSPAGNIPILVVTSAIYGFSMAGSSICYGFICDAIEYGDYKYGVRDDGLAFSLMSFGVKCATAITGAGGVLLLAAVGYVANAEQTAGTVLGINIIVNIVPAVLMAVSILVILFWYKLDEKKIAYIADKMKARREGKETMEEQLAQSNI